MGGPKIGGSGEGSGKKGGRRDTLKLTLLGNEVGINGKKKKA